MIASLAAFVGFAAAPRFAHPDRVRYDGQCFTIEGKDVFLYGGAFHYFRCPKAEWRARFQRIKDAGFNAVETYVAWNWNEREKPKSLADTSHIDLRDLDEWLSMAEQYGLYTIVRPGPYICSEWATGGFPNWLMTFKPQKPKRSEMWLRSDDPVFEAWSHHWMKAVAKVVAKHQIGHRPKGSHGVILWQVENEYDYASLPEDCKRNYVRFLIQKSQEDGIDVPIFTCWTQPVRSGRNDPVLGQAFDNPNLYPRWSVEEVIRATNQQHQAQPDAPKMVTEFQGGWFGQVGGLAAEEQDGIDAKQINALTLLGIQNGMAGLNYYMLFGGTNFGDWAGQGITTSYDYFAPIREWGGSSDKYRVVQAIGRMLKQYGPDLVRSQPAESSLTSESPDVAISARKGRSGATYLFVRNLNRARGVVANVGPVSKPLGPFGMNVYRYVGEPSNGRWLVNPAAEQKASLPPPIRIGAAQVASAQPTGWKYAPYFPTTASLGIWDSRFVFYRAVASRLSPYLWLKSPGSELVGNLGSPVATVQGGQVYRVAGPFSFVLLNSGWSNGGLGMEEPRGIPTWSVPGNLPQGFKLDGWRGKRLEDRNDRSLVGPGVDTSSWTTDVGHSLWPQNTAAVVRTTVDLGAHPSSNLVFNTAGIDDEGWFYVNGNLVGEIHHWDVPASFAIGKFVHPGVNDVAVVVLNNAGEGGLSGPMTIESPLPGAVDKVRWQCTDKAHTGPFRSYRLDTGKPLPRLEHPRNLGARQSGPASLVVSRVSFQRPRGRNAAWEIVLQAGGDGFLTLNGKPFGRYWSVGPQRAYYLPGSMLRSTNVLEYRAVRGGNGDRITAAELRALPQ